MVLSSGVRDACQTPRRDRSDRSDQASRSTRKAQANATAIAAEAEADAALEDASRKLTAATSAKDFLVRKYVEGNLHATDLAEMSWYLANAGLDGFKDLMLDPSDEGFHGHASRRVRAALGMDKIEAGFSSIELPLADGDARERRDMPMVPIADVLTQEFNKHSSTILAQTEELIIPNWLENEVRLEAIRQGHLPVPYGMFIDAAPWKGKGAGTRDAVVNYLVSFLGNHSRRVIHTFRKDHLCGMANKCPCRGRCTLDTVETAIAYHANWAADGIVACKDFDNRLWQEKRNNIGQPFLEHEGKRVRFVFLELRSDWDQYSGGMGMPYTKQAHFCFAGPCQQAQKFERVICWTHSDFMVAMQSCRIELLVGHQAIQVIWSVLQFDFRKNGMHGRCVTAMLDVWDYRTNAVVRLLPRDRLDMGGSVRDVHCDVQDLKGGFPFRLWFWRKPTGMNIHFFSKLMEIRGFKHEYWAIDDMHTLDLGPSQVLSGETVVRVLKSQVLGNAATEEGLKAGCSVIMKKLRKHYQDQAVVGMPRASRIGNITLAMLSYHKSTCTGSLKAKASESRHFLPFAYGLLTKKVIKRLGRKGQHLKRSIHHLLQAYKLMATSGRNIDSDKLTQHLWKCHRRALRAGVHETPKFHLMRHMGPRSKNSGNPMHQSSYLDESKNKDIIRCCQSAHVADFGKQVLCKDHLAMRYS